MKWIKTSDRLPEHEQEVLAFANCEIFILSTFHVYKNIKIFEEDCGRGYELKEITHWMELPEEPKE